MLRRNVLTQTSKKSSKLDKPKHPSKDHCNKTVSSKKISSGGKTNQSMVLKKLKQREKSSPSSEESNSDLDIESTSKETSHDMEESKFARNKMLKTELRTTQVGQVSGESETDSEESLSGKDITHKQSIVNSKDDSKTQRQCGRAKAVEQSDSDESFESETNSDPDVDNNSDMEEMETKHGLESGSESDSDNQEEYQDNSSDKRKHTPDSYSEEDEMRDSGDDDMQYDDDDDDDNDDIGADIEDNKKGREQDEYTAIRKELSDIPFEDLLKIKEKVGVKAFNKILHGNIEEKQRKTTFKRTNKNRPREMSAKRPVGGLKRKIETKPVWTARDPRFDDLSGEFKEEHFAKNYSFIEEVKEKERMTVKKEMAKAKNAAKKHELKLLLNRMQQEQQVKESKKKQQDLENTYRAKEKELVKEGKKPYFLKSSDKKTLELAMKFKELKKAGRLDSYMTKKRKKVAQKQRKKMPSKHK